MMAKANMQIDSWTQTRQRGPLSVLVLEKTVPLWLEKGNDEGVQVEREEERKDSQTEFGELWEYDRKSWT